MAHVVWRIAADTADYTSVDLSGRGAEKTGGRWNRRGTSLIYSADSIALACLETLVHLSGADPLPLNRYLVKITIPPSAWKARTKFKPSLHPSWDAIPAGLVSLDCGTIWARSAHTLIAEVPSIVVPEERNILINPAHADAAKLTVKKMRRWTFDIRLSG
jgi:RES domain-containing protein